VNKKKKKEQTLITLEQYNARNNHTLLLKYFTKNESPLHKYGRALTIVLCIPETAG
jgi:hypothetical protein